jgi:glycosyltransferase involved in cell wall biosynthesis
VTNSFLLNLSRKLEEFLYRRSYLITGQTMGIINNITSRFPDKKIFWLKNGAVFSENLVSTLQAEGWRMKMGFRKDDFILIYAGIFGHAQGLEVIIQAAARLNSYPEIRFILLGSGPVEEQLVRSRDEMNLQSTVTILPSVPRNEFLSILAEADAAIIPLRRLDLFKGAIPSKIFENLLMKKPILLGVEGEAETLFIGEAKAGLSFIPEDASDLAEKILQLSNNRQLAALYGENGFNYIREYFNWDTIAEDLWELLVEK